MLTNSGAQIRKCGLYVRVSTDRQASKEFSSLDTQEDVLTQLVQDKDTHRGPDDPTWKVVKTYVEAKSAKDTNRPAFQEMLRDVRAGIINMIVFIRLDRFSRSLRDFLNLQDFLKEHGCGFVSKYDPILDTSNPHGDFIVKLLMLLAEYERKLTAARTREKMAWRATQGLRSGGHYVLGYDPTKEPKGSLVPNAEEAKVVRFLFETYRKTRSLRLTAERANELGYRTKHYRTQSKRMHGGSLWSKGTVWQILTRPLYLGLVLHNGETFKGKHPPIIDQELWTSVQTRLQEEAPQPNPEERPRAYPFMLNGMASCGICRSSLVPQYAKVHGEHHYYYRCRAKYNGKENCPLPVVQAAQLEELVCAEVRKLANNADLLSAALAHAHDLARSETKSRTSQLGAKSAELAKLEREERNLLDFIKQGGFDAEQRTPQVLMEELQTVRERAEKCKRELDALEVQRRAAGKVEINPEAIQDGLAFFDTVFDLLTPAEKTDLVRTYVQRVVYTPEKVQILVYSDLPYGDDSTRNQHLLNGPPVAGSGSPMDRNRWLGR